MKIASVLFLCFFVGSIIGLNVVQDFSKGQSSKGNTSIVTTSVDGFNDVNDLFNTQYDNYYEYNDNDYSDENIFRTNNRHLLAFRRRPAPVVHKTSPKPAPVHHKQAPVHHKQAPTHHKVLPKQSPAPKTAPKQSPAPKTTPKQSPVHGKPTPAPTLSSVISQRAGNNNAALAKKIEAEFNNWMNTPNGKDAAEFCNEFKNRPDIYQGCLEDIKVTGSKALARQGAIVEEEFRSKSKISRTRKFCVASGDPHFTNYDGDYFHLQEKGVFTLMRTRGFEVQEKMRKNGADKPGVPSCLSGLAVRYNDLVIIEVNAENFKKIIVNGAPLELPSDYTMKFGGLEVRYGNQKFEWRGDNYKTTALKITSPNGFGVMVSGGYCGVVELNVPAEYFNKVDGLCGNADGSRDTNDYKNPIGQVMNVNRGSRNWEMSGYNGPSSPLSKWQLSWKPLGDDCYFQSGCEPAPKPASATVPKVVPTPPPVTKEAPVSKPTPDTLSTMIIKFTCDNSFKMYVNGNLIGSGDTWTNTYTFTPKLRLGVDTIAIEGHDSGGFASFIGSFNDVITKPEYWLCKDYAEQKPPARWNFNDFNDQSWEKAKSYGKNSDNNIWLQVGGRQRPEIPSDAQWLWTADNANHDHIYCRYNLDNRGRKSSQTLSDNPAKNSGDLKTASSSSSQKYSSSKSSSSSSQKVSSGPNKHNKKSSDSSSSSQKVSSGPITHHNKSPDSSSSSQKVYSGPKVTQHSKNITKHDSSRHHRLTRTNILPKNLQPHGSILNSTNHCVASYLVLKYDGKGNVFIGGADRHKRIHNKRKDCQGNREGLQQVLRFNPLENSYFTVSTQSTFDGHSDCGGSAFWDSKHPSEFFIKCSWHSFGAQTPFVKTDVLLYKTPESLEKIEERDMNDLLGQWYLIASKNNANKKRECLIITIFRHDDTFFMKHSINMGKQVYQIRDIKIDSFAMGEQKFKMDSRIYSYKLTVYKHKDGEEHILRINNINNSNDERIFGAQVYSGAVTNNLIKTKYNDFSAIHTGCYSD